MKSLAKINPLLIIVQAMALGVPYQAQDEIVDFFADKAILGEEIPELDSLQAEAQDLINAGKATARLDTYHFYGMYQEEPQTYDGVTVAWVPQYLDEATQIEYAEAAAALHVIKDNDSVDILDNFDLENIELQRQQFLVIGRKVGDKESGNRIMTVEADSEAEATETFVSWLVALENKCHPSLNLKDSDVIVHIRSLSEVQNNLLIAPRQ